MAGSYFHCVTHDGNLKSPRTLHQSLENGGDVWEAVEELYGMIWLLASNNAADIVGPRRDARTADIVEEARKNYKLGLKVARAIPDKPSLRS